MSSIHKNSTGSYRSVVALNNIGVALIEKNCFRSAEKTLKDATEILRKASRHVQCCSCKQFQPLAVPVMNKMLKEADRRLSNNKPSVGIKFPINVISDEVDLYNLTTATATGKHCVFEPVRIDLNSIGDELDKDLVAAIVVWNFSLACLLQAHAVGFFVGRHRLLVKSTSIMQLAARILSCIPVQSACSLALSILVYRTMGTVLLEIGEHIKAGICVRQLAVMQSAALQVVEIQSQMHGATVAAAAAA